MQFLIQNKNLVDFPYDPKLKQHHSLFIFDREKVDNLVSEILYASPTCYLISGYRGAGKTSFIKKVQEECDTLVQEKLMKISNLQQAIDANEDVEQNKILIAEERTKFDLNGVLFVYSSFSRYENQTFFLRKIIRDLQETVLQHDSLARKEPTLALNDLFKQTFYEVKEERTKSMEQEASVELTVESDGLWDKVKTFLPFVVAPFANELLHNPAWAAAGWLPWVRPLVLIGLFIWGLLNIVKFTGKYIKKWTTANVSSATSLTDDNITEYYLEDVIDRFINLKYKLVFVLDELDKVDDEDLDKLLKEMKPWLVRGKADFIIVAGQKLTMRYYQMKERDDEILASLFSKIIHIGLLSEQQFTTLFKDFLVTGIAEKGQAAQRMPIEQMNKDNSALAYGLCNSYIYRSKRLPRTFMNLVRQELKWEQGEARLDCSHQAFQAEELKMKILRKISEKINIDGDLSETERGHVVMQLFRAAAFVNDRNRGTVTVELLANEIITSKDYDAEVASCLQDYIRDFYAEAVNEKLITTGVLEKAPNAIKEEANELKSPAPSYATLNKFAKEFMETMELFLYIRQLLPEGKYDPGRPVSSVIGDYASVDVIEFNPSNYSPLQTSVSNLKSRRNDPSAFADIYESLKHISLTQWMEQVLHYFTLTQLRSVFEEVAQQSDSPEVITDFIATSNDNSNLLIDFKFINSTVEVSFEEASRAINVLDEFHMYAGKGGYYVSIIFYKSEKTADSDQLSISANGMVEKVRGDLKDKVRYIILSVSEAEKLHQKLKELNEASAYDLTPTQKEPRKVASRKRVVKSSVIVPDDPQKGKWGGQPVMNAKQLSARITEESKEKKRFRVNLLVKSLSESSPLTGKVSFYLHDSFSPDHYTVIAKDNMAELELFAYGAFTVGVSCDNNTTQLELDLSELKDAPKEFREN